MKSYFAKLADRATIGNPTTSLAVSAKQPSIERDSISDELEPQEQHARSTTRIRRSSLADSSSRSDITPQTVEPARPIEVLVPTRIVKQVETPVIRRPAEAPADPFSKTVTDEAAREILRPHATEESTESGDDWLAGLTRLAAVHEGQIRLLNRADEFMSDLLTRKKQSDQPRDIEDDKQHQPAEPTQLRPATTPALVVPRQLSRTPEQAETPSLVIGKLTVEVSSSTPQPPQSPRVIVVQRSDHQRNIAPSSLRFGLGQF